MPLWKNVNRGGKNHISNKARKTTFKHQGHERGEAGVDESRVQNRQGRLRTELLQQRVMTAHFFFPIHYKLIFQSVTCNKKIVAMSNCYKHLQPLNSGIPLQSGNVCTDWGNVALGDCQSGAEGSKAYGCWLPATCWCLNRGG